MRTQDRLLAEPHRMGRQARIVAGKGKDMTQEEIHRASREIYGTCATEQEIRFATLVATAEREKLAHWMRSMGYATGHGDAIEDLLDRLGTQIAEGLEAEVLMEREACAKVGMLVAKNGIETSAAIRARGDK